MKKCRKTRSMTVAVAPQFYRQVALLAKKVSPLLTTHRAHLELLELAVGLVEAQPELLRERLGL